MSVWMALMGKSSVNAKLLWEIPPPPFSCLALWSCVNLVARGFYSAEPSHMTALVYLPCQSAKVHVHGMCLRRRVRALAFASCGAWLLTCVLSSDSLCLYNGSPCWASDPLRVRALHVDARRPTSAGRWRAERNHKKYINTAKKAVRTFTLVV